MRGLWLGVLGLTAIALAGGAAAQQTKPACTDNSRECLLKAAGSYYDAMRNHDGTRAWLAPNVRRTLQAGVPQGNGEDPLCIGEKAVRDSLNIAPPQIHLDERFWVDEGQHTVFALILLALKERPTSIHVAERFKVENGLITEIEALFFMDNKTANGTTGWPMQNVPVR